MDSVWLFLCPYGFTGGVCGKAAHAARSMRAATTGMARRDGSRGNLRDYLLGFAPPFEHALLRLLDAFGIDNRVENDAEKENGRQ